jgi:histidine triad (HIT) family protein
MRNIYNKDNIFWKIIKEEIPCKRVIETKYSLSFYDINPKARIHVLVIPKGMYTDFSDFHENASNEEIVDFLHTVQETVEILKIKDSGFRIINNNGIDAKQEVPHYHWHILNDS